MRVSSPVLLALLAVVIIISCATAPRVDKSDPNKYCGQSAETVDFGSVLIGESKLMTLVISANDVEDETVEVNTTVTCEDKDLYISDHLGEVETGEQEIVLTEGQETTVYLKFRPTTAGVITGTLAIGSDCKDVTLTGSGAVGGEWSIDRIPDGTDLYDIWGTAYQAFACGDAGTVINKIQSEGEWTAKEGTGIGDVPLRSVWGFQGDAVWFAGGVCDYSITYAKAYRYYETLESWTELQANMIDCYASVWGTGACNLYFCGGAISGMFPNAALWNCSEYETFIIGMEYDLVSGIFGSGPEDIWAVQASHFDSLYHYNGTGWEATKESFMDKALFDVWVAPGGEACAVGAGGAIYYYNGSSWEDHTLEASTDTLFGVWGLSADNIYAAGTNATILHWDGNIWAEEDTPVEVQGITLYSIWMRDSEEGFAVGRGGLVLMYRGVGLEQ